MLRCVTYWSKNGNSLSPIELVVPWPHSDLSGTDGSIAKDFKCGETHHEIHSQITVQWVLFLYFRVAIHAVKYSLYASSRSLITQRSLVPIPPAQISLRAARLANSNKLAPAFRSLGVGFPGWTSPSQARKEQPEDSGVVGLERVDLLPLDGVRGSRDRL